MSRLRLLADKIKEDVANPALPGWYGNGVMISIGDVIDQEEARLEAEIAKLRRHQ